MSRLRAEIMIYTGDDGEPVGTSVEVDTEDTGTPWLSLLSGIVTACIAIQRKVAS